MISYGPFTRAITTIDRRKLVARVTVEGTARDLSQLPKVCNGGYSLSDKGSN